MTESFREILDESAKNVADYFERKTALGWRYAERTRQTTKIKMAIEGESDFSHMICDDGSCGSIFCMVCRKRKQESLHSQYKDRVKRFDNENDARNDLRYITILHEFVAVSYDTKLSEMCSLEDIEKSVSHFRARLKSVYRHFDKNHIWARGAIHLELINMGLFRFASLSGRQTTKQKTLSDMENDTDKKGDFYILVHSHILCDINGNDEDDFRKYLRRKWNVNKRQVDITRLTEYYIDATRFTKHTVAEAIKNIAYYGYNGSNGRLSFATNWGSSRKVYTRQQKINALGQINQYVEGVEGLDAFDEYLSLGDLRFLIRAHNLFTDNDGRGLLIRVG